LKKSYEDLEASLTALDAAQTALIDETVKIQDYIAENSLWVADLKPVGVEDAAVVGRGAAQVFSPTNWITMGELLVLDGTRRPWYWLAMLLGLAALFHWAARLRHQLILLGRRIESGQYETCFVVTLKGIL